MLIPFNFLEVSKTFTNLDSFFLQLLMASHLISLICFSLSVTWGILISQDKLSIYPLCFQLVYSTIILYAKWNKESASVLAALFAKTAVICPIYHNEQWQQIRSKVINFPNDPFPLVASPWLLGTYEEGFCIDSSPRCVLNWSW